MHTKHIYDRISHELLTWMQKVRRIKIGHTIIGLYIWFQVNTHLFMVTLKISRIEINLCCIILGVFLLLWQKWKQIFRRRPVSFWVVHFCYGQNEIFHEKHLLSTLMCACVCFLLGGLCDHRHMWLLFEFCLQCPSLVILLLVVLVLSLCLFLLWIQLREFGAVFVVVVAVTFYSQPIMFSTWVCTLFQLLTACNEHFYLFHFVFVISVLYRNRAIYLKSFLVNNQRYN